METRLACCPLILHSARFLFCRVCCECCHSEDRRSSTGGAFLRVAAASTKIARRLRVCTMSTSQVHYHLTQHNHKGLALCSRCHLACASEGTPVGPDKHTHGTLGPEQRGGRWWPTPTPKGRSAHAMTHTQDSPTHKSSDKHGSGAGYHQLQVTITNRRRRLSRYRRRSSIIRYR